MTLAPFVRAACLAAGLAVAGPSGAQLDASTATRPVANASIADPVETGRAEALFDRHWRDTAELYPEWATFRGDHRFGDRLSDRSPEGRAKERAYWRRLAAELDGLSVARLGATDRLSVAVLKRGAGEAVALERFDDALSMSVNASPFPFQSAFLGLLQATPVATEAQVRQLLARIAAVPLRMAEELAQLRVGLVAGWVPPRPVLRVVLSQLDQQLAASGAKSVYFEPFKRLGTAIAPERREALRTEGAAAIDAHLLPAIRQLRDFVAGDYLAAAADEGGLGRHPRGKEVYEALVRVHTTTDLSSEQIHAIGLEEVARIQREMDAIRAEVGFAGDMAAFRRHLNSDPRFFHAGREQLLSGLRDIAKRIEPELPRLFAVLPRAPYGIRALPDFMGTGAVETYVGPSLDGTRPGWFNANTLAFATRPVWAMEALVLHEAVPGHHLQVARAAELTGIPVFRRAGGFTAFGEGWALYAETLGAELGLYRDPYSRFGFQQNQAWRAARLVIDTGLHARGWTRQQAIDYLRDATGFDEAKLSSEVDRYLSWPGQALAYMIGQRKFRDLRSRAEKALGPRFDLRRFHMILLDGGQLPMDLLEREVDQWIAAQAP